MVSSTKILLKISRFKVIDLLAERCPGVPECGYHGKCYNGKCYCDDGFYGPDCQSRPKLLIVGGTGGSRGNGNNKNFIVEGSVEIFDLESGKSCATVNPLPSELTDGELMWMDGALTYCGGKLDDANNASECYLWSEVDQGFLPYQVQTLNKPSEDMDSVFVPKIGWWFIGGMDDSNDVQTEYISIKDRSDLEEVLLISFEPCLEFWHQSPFVRNRVQTSLKLGKSIAQWLSQKTRWPS